MSVKNRRWIERQKRYFNGILNRDAKKRGIDRDIGAFGITGEYFEEERKYRKDLEREIASNYVKEHLGDLDNG